MGVEYCFSLVFLLHRGLAISIYKRITMTSLRDQSFSPLLSMTPSTPYKNTLARFTPQLAGALLKTIPCARHWQFCTSTPRCTFQQTECMHEVLLPSVDENCPSFLPTFYRTINIQILDYLRKCSLVGQKSPDKRQRIL